MKLGPGPNQLRIVTQYVQRVSLFLRSHTKSDLRKIQEQDQNIGPLYRWLVIGKRHTLRDVQMESTEPGTICYCGDPYS